jgi:uncharacterized membrane protein YfcA
MNLTTFSLLFGAGLAGGAMNAVAGGGTFFTFPALLAAGVPPVAANASSAIAVWPGHALAVPAYRAQLGKHGALVARYSVVALLGGAIGAWLLLSGGDRTFGRLIPWLILFATGLFALSPKIVASFTTGRPRVSEGMRGALAIAAFLAIAVYGGYFAAGLGVLMLSGITLMGIDDIQDANGIKNLLAAVATTVAVVIFLFAGVVRWHETGIMLGGSVIGGYLGGWLARHLRPHVLRWAIIAVGLVLTVYYFSATR